MAKKLKVSHQPSLKTVYKKLERNEPFNNIEQAQFNKKEQALIRGIQLRDKESKQQAIQTFINYQREGKKATKSLAASVRKYNKSKYPKHGGKIERRVSDFERPKKKTDVRKKNKKEVKNFLSSKKFFYTNPQRYNRIKKGSKIYPNASLFELEHGVNSKASQKWRVNNGLTRNYK